MSEKNETFNAEIVLKMRPTKVQDQEAFNSYSGASSWTGWESHWVQIQAERNISPAVGLHFYPPHRLSIHHILLKCLQAFIELPVALILEIFFFHLIS